MPLSPIHQKKLSRTAHKVAVLCVTVLTLAGAGAAVVGGAGWLSNRAEASESAAAPEPLPVSVRRLVIEDGFRIQRHFLGQLEAAQTANMSFEFGGRLVSMLVDEGDTVTRGTPIATLDTALLETDITRLKASRDALEAQLDFSEKSLQRRETLNKRGFTSKEAYDQALARKIELKARIAETNATIQGKEIQLSKSTLYAPFDGQIATRYTDPGTTVAGGSFVVTLLETAQPRVRVGLPVAFQFDVDAAVNVDIAGVTYAGEIDTLRPDIDAATRTRTAILTLQNGPQRAYGQTASVRFDVQVGAKGAWVPIKTLREGTNGQWTILMVDENDRIRPAAVEILHSETSRVYVRGSFRDGSQMLDVGQHRVTPGQIVRVLETF